jgi:2-oxoglutarate ferredoxin oxidoreductase subunit gamma
LQQKRNRKEIVSNIIMLGALTTATTVVSGHALEKAILDSVPKGTEQLNLKAMKRGQELGQEGSLS